MPILKAKKLKEELVEFFLVTQLLKEGTRI